MKRWLSLFMGLFIMAVIVFLPPNNQAWWEKLTIWKELFMETEANPKSMNKQVATSPYDLPTFKANNLYYLRLADLKKKLSLKVKVDEKNGQVFIRRGKSKMSFLRDVAVMEKNGIYAPMDAPLRFQEDEIWIPLTTVEQMFQREVQMNQKNKARLEPSHQKDVSVRAPVQLPEMSSEELVQYLSFLDSPIRGAHVTTQTSSLPGAPRTYRKGIHEGIDWYGGVTGTTISKKTPIISMADGVVVRADHDYKEWTPKERQQLLAIGRKNNGQTPQYVLDKLRGCSVWIQHRNGLMARYVHLSRVSEDLKVGQKISKGELIGYVGNSGTSDGAKGNNQGIHLHLDLFLYGEWFWKDYTMGERKKILTQIFPRE